MNFKRLYKVNSRIIISILLGLGLATLFRKVCTYQALFKAPEIEKLNKL